jgi:hypothetical protein
LAESFASATLVALNAVANSLLGALTGRRIEMKKSVIPTVTIFMLSSLMTPSFAEPLKTMADVGRAINTCWTAPSGLKGTVTLSFSFKRDGSLFGKPRPTNINVEGDDKARQQFIESAINALSACTPLTFSSGLAEGIGGQVFTMPFSAPDNSGVTPTVNTQ